MTIITRRPAATSVLTATALASGLAFAVPAAALAEDPPVPGITGGSFTWGINANFLGYLASPAAGAQLTGTDGAEYADREFTFPVAAADSAIDAAGTAHIALDGGIDLKAHEGKGPDGGWGLDLSYDNLSLTVVGTAATLTGDYDVSDGLRSGDDVDLVTFTLAEPIDPATGEFTVTDVSTAAAQGVTDSLGHYPVGTDMAPADLSLSFAAEPAAGNGAGQISTSSNTGSGVVGVPQVFAALTAFLGKTLGASEGAQLSS